MKRLMILGTTTIILTMFACTYLLGTAQGNKITNSHIIIKACQAISSGYISNECLSLDERTCYYRNDGHTYFKLGNTGGRLDDSNKGNIIDLMEHIPEQTEDFNWGFVDMQKVVGFTATEDGLQLYFEDGTGYWWEW